MSKISYWFIWKKGYKTFINNKGKTIPILILMILAIGFSTAMFDVQDVRGKAIDESIEKTKFADGFVFFDPLPYSDVVNLLGEEILTYFDDYEMRLVLRTKFDIEEDEFDGIIVGLDLSQEKKINILLDENKNEIEDIEFLLNWDFANKNDVEIGDEATIEYGSIKKTIEIEEIGYNPEFKFLPLYENMAVPSIKPYPVLYVDLNYLNLHFLNQSTPIINQMIYDLNDEGDQDDIEDLIEEKMGDLMKDIIAQEDHPFIKSSKEDQESDRILFLILTIILIASSIITLILVMNRLIEEDLKSVSIFQGLGANKHEILGSFLVFNIILIGLSIIFGIIVGFLLNIPFNMLILDAMGIPFLPESSISYNNSLIIGTTLFLVSLLSTYLIVKKTFKMDVQQTLKYETKHYAKTNLVEKIYLKIKKVPHPFTIYNIRRIFGRKLHLLSLLTALSFSASMLIYSYAFPDSISYSVNRKLNEIERWDCVASMWQYENETIVEDTIANFREIDGFELGIVDTVLFSEDKSKNYDERFRLMAFEKNSKLHQADIQDGRDLNDQSEIVISKDIVRKYGYEIDDQIYIKGESGSDPHHMVIVGIIDDLTAETIYLSIDMAQKVLNQTDKVNTVYFTVDGDIDEICEKVQDIPIVELIVKKENVEEEFEYVVEMFSTIIVIFGMVFTLFGIFLILIIIKSIIEYRLEDYGNMKAVGLLNSELKKPLRLELLFYFIVASIIGLILGYSVMVGLIEMYSYVVPGLQLKIYPISYVYFISNMFAMLVITYVFNVRKLKKMNIAEIMRLKTFG